MITNYIPLKSVLYDLSLVLDPSVWNESTMTEWAIKALRKTASSAVLEDKLCLLNIVDHKFQLPLDLKYINQIIYNSKSASGQIMDDEELQRRMEIIYGNNRTDKLSLRSGLILNNGINNEEWIPLKLSTNNFSAAITCTSIAVPAVCNGKECEYEYSVDTNMIVTTTLKSGIVAVSYKAYPRNIQNETLMPDDEDLKEAIMHYLLYNHYLTSVANHEGGVDLTKLYISERNFHLKQFEVLKAKAAAKLNEPTTDQLENIKRYRDRLLPKANEWKTMFSQLSNREKIRH